MATMMKARRKDLRILCAVVDCGTELAWVLEDATLPRKGSMVWFGPSWSTRQEDDVWTTATRRNIKRLQQGRHAYRRRRLAGDDSGPQGWVPFLPCDAICPVCGSRQTLDHTTLGVPDFQRSRIPTACADPRCPKAVHPAPPAAMAFCPEHGGPQRPVPSLARATPGYPHTLHSSEELQRWRKALRTP